MEEPILFNTEMVRAILDGRKNQTRRLVRYNKNGNMKPNYYVEGDILWVRETWQICDMPGEKYFYKASEEDPEMFNWKPSIHMPREAARLFLEVKNVRVERLQDITEEDAKAEGVLDGGCLNCGNSSYPDACGCDNPQPDFIDAFVYLWDSINGKRGYGWHINPWVWVIDFAVKGAD